MRIDNILLDNLTAQAKESSRLRMNMDLRNSDADSSQRILKQDVRLYQNSIMIGSCAIYH